MGIVNLKFRSHTMQVECNDPEKVTVLSETLNHMAEGFLHMKSATDMKLMFLIALTLLDELEAVHRKLDECQERLNAECEGSNRSLCDMLNYVAEYLENIAERLEK